MSVLWGAVIGVIIGVILCGVVAFIGLYIWDQRFWQREEKIRRGK
jgi:hypothetical protein